MLREVDLGHVVVDFATFVSGNVSGGVVALMHEFLEERVHLAVESLAVECGLHGLLDCWVRAGRYDLAVTKGSKRKEVLWSK